MENKKPRICEILGVEVGQKFNLPGAEVYDPHYINAEGRVVGSAGNGLNQLEPQKIFDVINGKAEIELVDKYTEVEKEIMQHMQAVGYRYMIRDYGVVFFTENKPKRINTTWVELGPCASLPGIYNGLFKVITQESGPVSIEEALT